MQLTTAPPLLFAIGVRIFLNFINPDHTSSTPDHLLVGIWQGVLLYHTLRHFRLFVFPVGLGIAGKLLYDFANSSDTTRCACVLLGVALGVLFTDILTQLFEQGRYDERVSEPTSPGRTSHEHEREREPLPSKRLRLVSFERGSKGKQRAPREQGAVERAQARAQAASPAPTYAPSIDTAITLDSLPSSIDPDNRLSPAEKDVATLRARASLADSERRRFKEERKWALSQGNTARADQLEWQVKRYAALMESFHKEADNKLIEAARKSAQPSIRAPAAATRVSQPARHVQTYMLPPSGDQQPQAGPSKTNGSPLVSVTVAGGHSRTRKRSGSILKPSVQVHTRDGTTRRV